MVELLLDYYFNGLALRRWRPISIYHDDEMYCIIFNNEALILGISRQSGMSEFLQRIRHRIEIVRQLGFNHNRFNVQDPNFLSLVQVTIPLNR